MESCCTNSSEIKSNESVFCKLCRNDGRKVDSITVKALLKEGKLYNFIPNCQYYYCETIDCDTVYFTSVTETYFSTSDIKTEIALKNRKRNGYLCFCFGHTFKEIKKEIKTKGETDIAERIAERVKLKSCACEVKNPSGRCCLSEIKKVIKEISPTTKPSIRKRRIVRVLSAISTVFFPN